MHQGAMLRLFKINNMQTTTTVLYLFHSLQL
jgi:hypothetical protein